MDKKYIAKRYLISVFLLFFVGAAFLLLFVSAANGKGASGFSLSLVQRLMLSAGGAAVAVGSFTGFTVFGLKIKEIKTKHAALMIVFYPLVLAFVTVFGIIMIIPKTVISVKELIRG